MTQEVVAVMDLDNPNTRAYIAMAQTVWSRYIQTHTLEDVRALQRKIERQRAIRRQLYGTPRPLSRD